MTDTPKRQRGRPPLPPDQVAVPRSIRLTHAEWAKLDLLGGVPWLRAALARVRMAPKQGSD